MASQARRHINEIRERKGFVSGKQNGSNTAEFERLLSIVGEQLYQESTHFLLELIQNTDDNNYHAKVVPTLDFTLTQHSLRIDCNETGFEPKNVDAICSVALSTKSGTAKSRYVGEKGIGFKSVFKVADVVSISSGSYTFNFDKNRELGMIAPLWCDFPEKKKPGYTSFILKLSPKCNKAELVQELRNLDPKSMIFLRRLRVMTVTITGYGEKDFRTSLKRQDDGDSNNTIITLHRDVDQQRYIVHKQAVRGLPQEEKRPGIHESEISLAFPLDKNSLPELSSQLIYAFLPIREYGFEFLINGDFLLTANRQDLVKSSSWNNAIVQGSGAAITEAFKNFAQVCMKDIDLRYTWIRYVPSEARTVDIFSRLKNEIRKSLAGTRILENATGSKAQPSALLYVPLKFRNDNGVPLTLCQSTGGHYLSNKYATGDSKAILNLGVREMEFSHFLADLKIIISVHRTEFNAKDKKDHSRIAAILLEFLGDSEYTRDIRALPIVKTRGGIWVSPLSGPIFFQGDKGGRDIPEGVDAMIIQSKFGRDPQIKNFYIALGVTQLDDHDICRVIISTHLNPSFRPEALPIDDLISHVLFLHDSGFQERRSASCVYLRAEDRSFRRAYELYQDSQFPHSARKYLDSTEVPFLDPYYLEAAGQRQDFSSWLSHHMDIWQIPRLVCWTGTESFEITPEFAMLLRTEPASQFLLILRDCWKIYSAWLPVKIRKDDTEFQISVDALRQTISTAVVKCRGGIRVPLSQTFLPLQDWIARKFPLPLLDIPDPESEAWKFLEIFGVGVKRNVASYLQCLAKVANEPADDPELYSLLSWLYGEIQYSMSNDGKLIRDAFAGKRMVFIPPSAPNNGYWLPLESCSWQGPNLKYSTSIQSLYPSNERLFCEILGLKDLEIEHVILEMENFRDWDDIGYINYIFGFLNDWFKKTKQVSQQILDLKRKRVFPVSTQARSNIKPSFSLMSCANHSTWVIADSEELERSFSGKVPFLALDLDTCLMLKPLFESMGLGSRMLSNLAKADAQITGPAVQNAKYTNFLRGKLDLIMRLIPENCEDRKDIVARLRNLEVYGARALQQRWSLQLNDRTEYGIPTPAAAVITNDQSVARIQLLSTDLQSSHHNFQYELADLLDVYCKVEDRLKGLMYLAITERNHRVVSQQFSKKGVRTLTQQEERDNTSYFQNVQANVIKHDGTKGASVSRLKHLAEGFENIKKVRIFDSRGRTKVKGKIPSSKSTSTSSNRYSVLSDLMDDSDFETREYHLVDSEDDSTDTDSDSEPDQSGEISGRLMLVTKGAKKMKRRKKKAHIEIDEDVATAGELFMAMFLSRALPDFYTDEQHWTSERRQSAGHGDVALADIENCISSFTIPDQYGVFTKFLVSIGLDECEAWIDKPPIYHIEAIGTEKGLNSSFPITSEWWKMARKYSLTGLREPDRIPNGNICLLARVYNLAEGEDPELSLFVDPWDYFMKNRLNIDADGLYIGRIRNHFHT